MDIMKAARLVNDWGGLGGSGPGPGPVGVWIGSVGTCMNERFILNWLYYMGRLYILFEHALYVLS